MAVPETGDCKLDRQALCPVSVESETTVIQRLTRAAGFLEILRLVVNMPTRLLY